MASTPPPSVVGHVAVNTESLYGNDDLFDFEGEELVFKDGDTTPPHNKDGDTTPPQNTEQEDAVRNILARPPDTDEIELTPFTSAGNQSPASSDTSGPLDSSVQGLRQQARQIVTDEGADKKMSIDKLNALLAELVGILPDQTPKPLHEWRGESMVPLPPERILELTEEERWNYLQNLKEVKEMNNGEFPTDGLRETYATVAAMCTWDKTPPNLYNMTDEQLKEYRRELREINLPYITMPSRDRVRKIIRDIDNILNAHSHICDTIH